MHVQAEQRYLAASKLKPAALQPLHGLVQLYRRTKENSRLAATLERIVASDTLKPEDAFSMRQHIARAYLDASEPRKAQQAVEELATEYSNEHGEDAELPPELVILQVRVNV